MKRIAIYSFFDKEGIVDDYVPYLLNDLRDNIDRLIIVCNGVLNPEGRERLRQFTNEVFVRENKGFDAGAYQDVLLHDLSWQELDEYDELLLLNDTFYGPFYPFSEMFGAMESKDCDFWGITIHGKTNARIHGIDMDGIPEHVQSYFIAFRHNLFIGREFRRYWENLVAPVSRDNAIGSFELSVTKTFSNAGYKYAAYCDTRALDDQTGRHPLNHYAHNTTVLLTQFRCPVLKRNIFCGPDRLIHDNGEDLARTFSCIEKNTEYDVGMIYRNLLRNYNITDLKWGLHWDYILSKGFSALDCSRTEQHPRVLIITHLYYEDILDECLSYGTDFPVGVDWLITTNNEKVYKKLQAQKPQTPCRYLGVRKTEARGRDVAALVISCRDIVGKYELVCFTHDKKTSAGKGTYAVGRAFRNLVMENTIGSGAYIENVIQTFNANPCLGVACPPAPYAGWYRWAYQDFWTGNYENTFELAEKLKLHCRIERNKPPIMLGTALWFRPQALKPLFDYPFKNEDFPKEPLPSDNTFSHAVERIFPYVAQSEGFYTAWVMTTEYGCVEVENLSALLRLTYSFPQGTVVFGSIELAHAAVIAKERDEKELRTTGYKTARTLYRLVKEYEAYKHDLPVRNDVEKEPVDAYPSVDDAQWLKRETFKIWVKKLFGLQKR